MEQLAEMTVTWSPYVWPQARPADPARIAAAERALGIRFPADYRAIVLQHQGQTPEPSVFSYGDGYQTVFNHLLHFEDDPSDSNLLDNQQDMTMGDVPEGLVVFAGDPSGNRICFDYRHGGEPGIVLVDYNAEQGGLVVPLATSFTELIERLG